MELTDKKWGTFVVSDIFRIEPTKGGTTNGLEDGTDVPYIAASHTFQGFNRMCSSENVEHWISKGNCIIFVNLGDGSAGYANYMKEDFIGMSGKTSVGYIDGIMTPNIGKFLETILCQERFRYGHERSWADERLTNTKIQLPIDDNGNPDWNWIEQYMTSLETDLDTQVKDIMEVADGDKNIIKTFADKVEISDFKAWLNDNANMDADNQMSLDSTDWSYFKVGDLFNIHPTAMYKNMSSANLNDGGSTPVIVNSAVNNGVGGMSTLAPTEDGHIITYSDTTDGNTFFYHNEPFIGFAHVQGMYPKGFELSQYTADFLIGIFTFANKGLYDYNRKFRRDKFIETQIYLPVNDNGNTDWEWIEQYMKSLPYSDKEQIGV